MVPTTCPESGRPSHLSWPTDPPEKQYCRTGSESLSIEPWNTAAGGRADDEDIPPKFMDRKLTDHLAPQKRGATAPFSFLPTRMGSGRA